MSEKNNINDFQGRIFTFSFPARLTGTAYPLPARNLAVVVFPDAPKQEKEKAMGSANEKGTGWNGWYPQCKPGMEGPWDKTTWGQLPNPVPEGFNPYAPVQLGEAYPLSKNELFPLVKKTRALFGRDFYAFILLFNYRTENGDMIYAHEEYYRLVGDFPGFENLPAIDL